MGKNLDNKIKNIALVAHDNKKQTMIEWASNHKEILDSYNLYATGTTGTRIMEEVKLDINLLKSGPHGGDMQIGALIAEHKLNYLIFFWDPLESHPHDVDVKALLRLSVLYNIPTACNRATANYLITSELFPKKGN